MSSDEIDLSELATALAAIQTADATVKAAVEGQAEAVTDATEVASKAVHTYLGSIPADVESVTLPTQLVNGLAEIWLAQYRWSRSQFAYRFYGFVDGLVANIRWTTVPEETSDPDPHKEEGTAKNFHVAVRRIIRY